MIPEKALAVLRVVLETGAAPEGNAGGSRFRNREGKLPTSADYYEFDVDPRPVSGKRNAERIVVDKVSGEAWYTPDHYETFLKLETRGG